LMMSLWDALRMNMMISYQELVRTFPKDLMAFKMCAPGSKRAYWVSLKSAVSEERIFRPTDS
ncbi:hypothetical protein, partial [Klebsiella pneumoniae]|uniref:hypothetical protein n=1 Tax=Klebsiella pneumoniae TaxID=573 RepID=UPI00211C922E